MYRSVLAWLHDEEIVDAQYLQVGGIDPEQSVAESSNLANPFCQHNDIWWCMKMNSDSLRARSYQARHVLFW